jgi:signal transduction histidine kinase
VVAVVRPEADRAGVSVALELPDTPVAATVDREQMTEVFLNIVLNAVQASRPGGSVRIRAETRHDAAVVEVTDEGHGIAAEHLGRIFEPFFTTKPRGTGLGLATSHRIVVAHGGAIEVASTSPAGTSFRIQLPVTAGHRPVGQPRSAVP